MANTVTQNKQDDKAGITERGIHSLLSWILRWDTAAAQTVTVKTSEQGAMSVCFMVDNTGPANLAITVKASVDGTNFINAPSKNETGSETLAGSTVNVASGAKAYIIITYSDYPRYAAFRFFQLSSLPDAAVCTTSIHSVLK